MYCPKSLWVLVFESVIFITTVECTSPYSHLVIMALLFWLKQKLSRSFSYLLIIQSDFCGLLVTRLTEFWHIVGVIYAMCSSRKYPYLPHGREFSEFFPPPPLWRFLLSFIHFFKFFGLIEPPSPRKFQSLLWVEYGYFLELNNLHVQ